MGGYHNFYSGYGKETDGDNFLNLSYRPKASAFGMATDPRSANQLELVSKKLNTGAKTIEMSPVQPDIFESIPDQHLEEINRLKKLVGSDITLHGPLVELTGLSNNGWDESRRMHAERQIASALERGHKLNPDGNTVVTFHTSQGLPEFTNRVINKDGKEEIKDFWVIDENGGKVTAIPIKPNYLLKDENPDPKKMLEDLNRENWENQLSVASNRALQGRQQIESVQDTLNKSSLNNEEKLNPEAILDLYKKKNTPEGKKYLKDLGEHNPEARKRAEDMLSAINYGDLHVREAYNALQTLFNQAYKSASEKDRQKLDEYRDHLAPKINSGNLLKDPLKLAELADEVTSGVKLLSEITPETYKPLNEFVIDKTADTFAGAAFNAYKQFGYNKPRDTTPILSMENPPAGQALSRAEDIKQLVEASRKKFIERAVNELEMDKEEAEKQAEKIIGVTWDVGHINMLRKHGYDDEKLVGQTNKIKEYVKHVHLSDNFGMEHTELPMGMGNVPKEQMELLQKYASKAKQIIETGNWYQHFQRSPLPETFAAFGSPIYSMKMAPYWNQAQGMAGGYFSGLGNNPDVHHSMYGAGFSNLPTELGGQFPGGRSRVSGNPME